MEPIITPILIAIGVPVIAGLILYRVKSQDTKIDKLTGIVSKLESTAVSDSHVRAVVKEELQPLQTLMEKIDSGMNGIKEYIAEEKGFKAGEAAARRRKEDLE